MLSRPLILCAFCVSVVLVPTRPGKAADKVSGRFEIEAVKNIAYYDGKDADPVKHKLDLYLPKGQKDFPVVVFVHGGGWKNGDKMIYGKLADVLVPSGIGAVVINYRLTPKVSHPGHIQDVAKAFAWVFRNIGKYGGRNDQIFVSGHSAGGHLAALLATNEGYLKSENLSLANVKGVIALSGVYNIRPGKLSEVFGKDEESCRKASPLQHINGKHPPFLIVYAEKDFKGCDEQSNKLCAALRKSQSEAAILEIKDRDHISIIRKMSHENDPATQALIEFVRKHAGLTSAETDTKKETNNKTGEGAPGKR
jgi:acetyl esterase/lipase